MSVYLLQVIGVDTYEGLIDIKSMLGCSYARDNESLSTYALLAQYTWKYDIGIVPAIEEILTMAHFLPVYLVLFSNMGKKYRLIKDKG